MSGVRVRGHGRRKPREDTTDWNTVGALMVTADMDDEAFSRFLWCHPELEGVRGMARTEGERRYLPRIYEREREEK